MYNYLHVYGFLTFIILTMLNMACHAVTITALVLVHDSVGAVTTPELYTILTQLNIYTTGNINALHVILDNRVLAKLPINIQAQYTYFLTDEEGITTDLLHWIQRARVSGSSLKALRQCMVEARHDRLHTTIVKYYQHCKEHKAYVMAGIAKLLNC